jgi:serine/threonine protein phosphatase PrpC
MKCPNCGQENRDIAHFCQRCGHLLEPAKAPQEVAEAAAMQAGDDQPAEIEASTVADTDSTVPLVEREAEPIETPEAVPESEAELTTQEPAPPDESSTAPALQQEDAESEVEAEPSAECVATETETEDLDMETKSEPDESTAQATDANVDIEPAETETAVETTDAIVEPLVPGTDALAETLSPVTEAEKATSPDATQAVQVETPLDEETIGEPLEETEEQEALVSLETETEEYETETEEYETEMQELTDADLLPWRDEAVPLQALAEGTVVQDRYRVAEVLAVEEQEILYRVRDLKRCPQCGFDDNSPDEAFCTSCGAILDEKPLATMMERPVERIDEPVEAEIEDQFTQDDRVYRVWREFAKREDQLSARQSMNMIIGQKSDTGMVRELDEDGLFVLTMARTFESIQDTIALFIVADGMGGHEGGEIASQLAIRTMANIMLHNVFIPELEGTDLSPDEIQDWMRRAGQAANDQVYLERQKRQNDMGTTLTAALIKDWTLYLAHVGDCRAYRWSENGLEQLTTDHSVVASMVAAGTAAPEEIYTHPQRSVIYRCVGDQPSVEVDTSMLSVYYGDRLVLCCDGLWEMLRNEGIKDILLRESDPQQACEVMVEQANLAGGTDNISVIVVQL